MVILWPFFLSVKKKHNRILVCDGIIYEFFIFQ